MKNTLKKAAYFTIGYGITKLVLGVIVLVMYANPFSSSIRAFVASVVIIYVGYTLSRKPDKVLYWIAMILVGIQTIKGVIVVILGLVAGGIFFSDIIMMIIFIMGVFMTLFSLGAVIYLLKKNSRDIVFVNKSIEQS